MILNDTAEPRTRTTEQLMTTPISSQHGTQTPAPQQQQGQTPATGQQGSAPKPIIRDWASI